MAVLHVSVRVSFFALMQKRIFFFFVHSHLSLCLCGASFSIPARDLSSEFLWVFSERGPAALAAEIVLLIAVLSFDLCCLYHASAYWIFAFFCRHTIPWFGRVVCTIPYSIYNNYFN